MEIKVYEFSKEITIKAGDNIFMIKKDYIKGTLIENYFLYEYTGQYCECNNYEYVTEGSTLEDILLYIQKEYL